LLEFIRNVKKKKNAFFAPIDPDKKYADIFAKLYALKTNF